MELKIHPKAVENLNSKAEKLKLKLRYKIESVKKDKSSETDLHIAARFNEADIIGEMKQSWTDVYGKVCARAFVYNRRLIGLFDEDYKDLVEIAEGIQKAISEKNVISFELISELIFDWMKRKFQGENISEMTDFVLAECKKHIVNAEVWIPISALYIQCPFKVGNITFKAITKKVMDEYEQTLLQQVTDPEKKKEFHIHFNNKRTEVQALAVATIKVEAEPKQAYKIALEETEKAMSVLRFFSPVNFYPTQTCYSAPLGKQHRNGDDYFLVQDGKIIGEVSSFSDKFMTPWNITKKDLEEVFNGELTILSDLLIKDSLTDFQQKFLDALFIYSRGTLTKEISDRLVYTLVALETIFLKDSSEAIQDNISLRMAFMQPVSVKERKEITANVKETYKLRSSFIHHGKSITSNNLEVLEKFMWNSWLSLQSLIPLAARSITKEQFFEDFENRKIGG